jgi:hypothetical protein
MAAAVAGAVLLPAHADFKVAELQPRLVDNALIVNGSMQLELSRKVDEALSKGIELPVIIEVRLYRQRAFLWNQKIESWTLRRTLRYHALSGQYIVSADNNADSFLSANDALKHLGTLSELRLSLNDSETTSTADEYLMKLRAHIDIEALPAPLRPVAYTTLSWHMNTGWTTWNVPR